MKREYVIFTCYRLAEELDLILNNPRSKLVTIIHNTPSFHLIPILLVTLLVYTVFKIKQKHKNCETCFKCTVFDCERRKKMSPNSDNRITLSMIYELSFNLKSCQYTNLSTLLFAIVEGLRLTFIDGLPAPAVWVCWIKVYGCAGRIKGVPIQVQVHTINSCTLMN